MAAVDQVVDKENAGNVGGNMDIAEMRQGHDGLTIREMVLENFKSYDGAQHIGPFNEFTSIIGPNGSGKSNIMDAISFVLGIQAKHLRGNAIRDLIHRKEHEKQDEIDRVASVELRLENEKGRIMWFKRTVNNKGVSGYKVTQDAGKQISTVSGDEFTEILKGINILVRARNFLVFQGDVTDLSSKIQTMELTRQIEIVSGSDQYKTEYEQLEVQKAAVEESVRFTCGVKRQEHQQHTSLQRQAQEAVQYEHLQNQSQRLKGDKASFELLLLETAIARHQKQVDSLGRQKKALLEEKDEIEAEMDQAADAEEEATKAEAASKKGLQAAEKERNRRQKLADELEHEIARTKNALEPLTKKRDSLQHWKNTYEKLQNDREADVEQCKEAIEILKKEKKDVPPFWKEANLSEKQGKEYDELKKEIEVQNAQTIDYLRTCRTALERAHQQERGARARFDAARNEMEGTTDELQKLQSEKITLDKDLVDLQASHDSCEQKLEKIAGDREELQDKLDELNNERETQTAFVREHRNVRQQKSVNALFESHLLQLHKTFGSRFYGRAKDLIKTNNRMFDKALTSILGERCNYLLVDTNETAKMVIHHIIEIGMAHTKVFPVSSARAVQSNKEFATSANNKNKVKRYHAPDCINGANERWPEVKKVFDEWLNPWVICTTLDDLRECVLKEGKRAKGRNVVRGVTNDGYKAASVGTMGYKPVVATSFGGGRDTSTSDIATQLKQAQRLLETVGSDINEIQNGIARLDHEDKKINDKSRNISKRLADSQQKTDKHKRDIDELERKLVDFEDNVAKKRKNVSGLSDLTKDKHEAFKTADEDVEKSKSKALEKFSKKVGIPDIAERERDYYQNTQKKSDQMLELEKVISDTSDAQTKDDMIFEHRDKELSKCLDLLAAQQAKSIKCNEDMAAASAQLSEISQQHGEALELQNNNHEATAAAKANAQRVRQEVKRKDAEIYECDQKAKSEKGFIKEYTNKRNKKINGTLFDGYPLHFDGEELEDIATALQGFEEDFQRYQFLGNKKLSFDHLPENHREIATSVSGNFDPTPVIEDYREKIADTIKQIGTINPNYKAIDQATTQEHKYKEAVQAAALEQKKITDVERKWLRVKQKRAAAFMKCFKHVELNIDDIYNRLTMTAEGVGGQAFLDLDDYDAPFGGGIKYTAMPPSKRFRDMALLSGGEKTMAALALLFAMHSYRQPPFMVLDEVDAPLDLRNTAALTRFLKDADFQAVVISLKDRFFAHSDSLIGVFKDIHKQTSGTLTLGLKERLTYQNDVNADTAVAGDIPIPGDDDDDEDLDEI